MPLQKAVIDKTERLSAPSYMVEGTLRLYRSRIIGQGRCWHERFRRLLFVLTLKTFWMGVNVSEHSCTSRIRKHETASEFKYPPSIYDLNVGYSTDSVST